MKNNILFFALLAFLNVNLYTYNYRFETSIQSHEEKFENGDTLIAILKVFCKEVTTDQECGSLHGLIFRDSKNKISACFHAVEVGITHRRNGIATTMMQYTEDEFKKLNVKKIFLLVVKDNKEAVKCFYKFGFYESFYERMLRLLHISNDGHGILKYLQKNI
jgi:hypothetical protein